MRKLILAALIFLANSAHAVLSDQIPYPFYTVQNNGENQVQMIDDGIEALRTRIDMIRRAKSTIEAEYFIFNIDTVAKIISKELIEAAKRGVKVRLLIDKSKPIFVFKEQYAEVMKSFGIEVRYYNTAPLWRVSTIQFRNHRKLLAIDDFEAITGGRNIADEYFDLSHEFNFNDTDIYVKGPIVKVMRESFDKFFENHLTKLTKPPMKYPPEISDFFYSTNQAELEARSRVDQARAKGALHKMYICPKLTFSTDAPGSNFIERLKPGFVDRFRYVRKTLYDKISTIDRNLVVASPYLIDTSQADDLMKQVLVNGAKINFYTNSLGSTDATYVAANMYLGLKRWRAQGIDVVLHSGKWLPNNPDSPSYVREAKTGLHSKVQIYLRSMDSEVMIGTYNVDHRSNFYNSEMALFCAGNSEFTDEVLQSVERNESFGLKVSTDGKSVTDRNGQAGSIYGMASAPSVRKMKMLTFLYWLVREIL